MGKFFKTCADHFAAESEHHGVMAKGWDENSEQHTSHADRADACSKLAKTCNSLADKCGKGDVGDFEKLFGDEVMPSRVSIVAPDAPGKTVRAVPRHGQPALPTTAADAVFEKIYGNLGTEE
jgi:hypothetical protein